MTESQALGRAIAVYRTAMDLPRKALAEEAGISYPYLCQIETGDREPSLPVLRSIASVLAVHPSGLLSAAERLQRGIQPFA